ncbi:hypothetical protein F2P81_001605 [Scophthalmus maximus]|uniref:Uncharacterized protein n=1 Tax=Scophthalmus maximus TaxID=52904 RepID=A0A6A4TBU6_SCOMX|nr:hypothetical protein F2P81_001605 [Scophthalmus maximus]
MLVSMSGSDGVIGWKSHGQPFISHGCETKDMFTLQASIRNLELPEFSDSVLDSNLHNKKRSQEHIIIVIIHLHSFYPVTKNESKNPKTGRCRPNSPDRMKKILVVKCERVIGRQYGDVQEASGDLWVVGKQSKDTTERTKRVVSPRRPTWQLSASSPSASLQNQSERPQPPIKQT